MRALAGSFSFGVRTGDLAATIPARLGSGSMSMGGQVGRTNGVREMPVDEQPRERMLRWGSAQLKTSELIAILLNTGTEGETVIKLSERILNEYGGLRGLTRLDLVRAYGYPWSRTCKGDALASGARAGQPSRGARSGRSRADQLAGRRDSACWSGDGLARS